MLYRLSGSIIYRSSQSHLVRSINLAIVRYGEAVILIQYNRPDVWHSTVFDQDFVKWYRQLIESRDSVMRQAETRFEEQLDHVQGR